MCHESSAEQTWALIPDPSVISYNVVYFCKARVVDKVFYNTVQQTSTLVRSQVQATPLKGVRWTHFKIGLFENYFLYFSYK